MCKHDRAGGGVINPDIRTETNPFHKSKCLFMFKESCALPRSITRVRCRYEFSPGITPEFILETPRFSSETPKFQWTLPDFHWRPQYFLCRRPQEFFWRPQTFHWELQTFHLIHKIFLLILEL